MTLSTTELLQNLRQFIQSEAVNQRQSIERQWARPIAERVYNGWAIEGLRLAKVNEKTRILNLICATNESRFREGDLLILHRGNPRDPNYQRLGRLALENRKRGAALGNRWRRTLDGGNRRL